MTESVAVAEELDESTEARPVADRLLIDLDGWDGPLDLLLQLAREQKVDISRMSILRLAEQYIDFIGRLRKNQLDLAAEYLVMAAWLAYLKSRLLLPEPEPDPGDEPSPAELAEALAFRLRRLQAMQDSGRKLFAGPRLGRDVFGPGAAEGIEVIDRPIFDLGFYDFLKVYADHVARRRVTVLTVEAADLWSVEDALARLETMLGLGALPDWSVLMAYLPPIEGDALKMKSAMASTFVAALELARQGRLCLRQDGPAYSPIYVRAGQRDGGDESGGDDD
ncbi:segregation and condensation protein A [Magnetospirillum fulvum]|uniref:Segregation and condensation protein A n=1 Tax=Magnetospirillum fulvum TaxID=1082 RepID=A0A1H6GSK7_MAGFU|nr:ScpA family protein [Magnetospirillum fulvum]SEH24835.1 condensin subunit ScpA [Magnetospirillum fulvum]